MCWIYTVALELYKPHIHFVFVMPYTQKLFLFFWHSYLGVQVSTQTFVGRWVCLKQAPNENSPKQQSPLWGNIHCAHPNSTSSLPFWPFFCCMHIGARIIIDCILVLRHTLVQYKSPIKAAKQAVLGHYRRSLRGRAVGVSQVLQTSQVLQPFQ